ncbi:MAG: DUF4328 domain-containing protein [Chitinophagales bacterium]|nr:DUF4328 domain-containing protein [Hyphomicrobiales bacterium]
MTEQNVTYRDASSLSHYIKYGLYAQLVLTFVAFIAGFLEYQILQEMKSGLFSSREQFTADANASDLRLKIVGIVQLLLFIMTAFLILKWIYRANLNARALGAEGMQYTPEWSVAWFFFPIVNLWKPYQAVKEICRASRTSENWSGLAISDTAHWWWIFFLIEGTLSRISFQQAIKAKSLDQYISANVVGQISEVVFVPLVFIFLQLMREINSMQQSRVPQQGLANMTQHQQASPIEQSMTEPAARTQ